MMGARDGGRGKPCCATFVDAWNRLDGARIHALMSDDIVYHNMPLQPVVGREAVRANLATWPVDEAEWILRNIATRGNVVLTERIDRLRRWRGWITVVPVMGRVRGRGRQDQLTLARLFRHERAGSRRPVAEKTGFNRWTPSAFARPPISETGAYSGMPAVLCAAHSGAMVDRFVMVLVTEPIRAAMHLSDTQLGLLQGTGFAILYCGFAVPLGCVADAANRRNLDHGRAGVMELRHRRRGVRHDL